MESKDVVYDRVMDMVGEEGKFQKRFIIVFNISFTIIFSVAYMNQIVVMSVPDHWCYVPGRNGTNYTIDEWKKIHIPMESTPGGFKVYSKCLMYNDSAPAFEDSNGNITITCRYGYDYDKRWFSQTAPSAQDWVCDKELYTSNLLAFSRTAEIIGSFIFGQIGDRFGRRLVYISGLVMMIGGRLLSIFTVPYYAVFVFCCAVAWFPSMTPTQSTQVIAMEISQSEARSKITMYQNVAWAIGVSIVPIVFWIARDWVIVTLITTLPLLLFVAIYSYLIESPRWLASKGSTHACLKELKKIAKTNGTFITEDTKTMLKMNTADLEKNLGVLSIFSSWMLAKNTFVILLGWASCSTAYNVLLLNVSYIKGNPFVGMMLQALVELPGYGLAMLLCEHVGRRCTGVGACVVGLAIMAPLTLFTSVLAPWVNMLLLTANKLFVTVAFFALALQTMEIYPTCLRQTGTSLGTVISSVGGIVAPYIVYWGSTVDARIPLAVLTICAILGILVEFLLPETLHVKLPESLQEAKIFGKEQKYWSIPKKDEEHFIKQKIKYSAKRLYLES